MQVFARVLAILSSNKYIAVVHS